ncbi:MAG: autotransporter-associated beta strand repeat-containing protein [Planctomycetales bacterium]|nr:autotransporter-associated beta strand repeat-containing protein [Planctomycetales bacterium]
MTTGRTSNGLTALFLGLVAAATATAQTTIYDHQFGGGGGLLNGTAEDFSATLWSANSFALDNGAIDGAAEGAAVLPASLAAGNLYNLELTVNVVSGVDRWVGLGFTDDAALANPGASDANDRFSNSGGRGWMLIRDHANAPQDAEFFAGANTGGALNEATDALGSDFTADGGGVYNLRIEYDTSPGLVGSLANFYVNNTLVVDNMLVDLSAVNFVGYSYDNDTATAPSVDNFKFTVTSLGVQNQWDVNGGGSFHDAGNWTVSVPGAGQTATFGAVLTADNSPATVSLTSPVSLGDIVFNNGGADYILDGPSTLTLTGDPDVNVNAGRHWLSVIVAGTGGVTKSGAGELILDAGNSFSGGLTVNDGRLSVTHPGAIPTGQNVQLTAASSNLFFGGDNGFFVDNGSTGGGYGGGTVGGVISGAGSVNVDLGATVTMTGANTFTGPLTVQGTGTTLTLSGAGTLGASDGTAASETRIGGAAQVVLPGVAVGNEVLKLDERADAGTPAHLTSSGASSWAGNLVADTPGDGSHYKIDSTSGTLTLSGTLSAFDQAGTNDRTYVFGGAGNINVTGRITDGVTDANGDFTAISTGDNVQVVKRGAGTLTISTGTDNNDDYWFGGTIVEEGVLKVMSDGLNNGELRSTVNVEAGASFDVSDFATYNLIPLAAAGEPGLGGGGTVNGGGATTIGAFEATTITPGDSVGTLKVNGNLSLTYFDADETTVRNVGSLNFELGSSAANFAVDNTVNDLISVSGGLTINANSLANQFVVNVTPVGGALDTSSNYVLVNAGSLSLQNGASASNFLVNIVNSSGAPVVSRQSASVVLNGANGEVELDVSGTPLNLTWAGTVGNNTWDVASSNNWSGGNQFFDLDSVTFGAGGEKNVLLSTSVSPGATTFNSSSTYTFTGAGGLAGGGPVNVNAGTVKLLNTGNAYTGVTTVAQNARLEMVGGSAGGMVINGTLAAVNNTVVTLIDDFEDASLAEYTFAKILDQGTATNTSFLSAAGVLANTSAGADGAEQALLFRNDFQLSVGEELRVDAELATASGNDLGIAIGQTPSSLANGASGDVRTSADFLFISFRATTQLNSRGFNGGAEVGQVQSFGVNANQLFIARTASDTVELGWYDNGQRNVLRTETVAASMFDNIGFYGDLRADGAGYSGLDDLRFQVGGDDLTLNVNGDLLLNSTGALEFEISSTGVADLAATGAATLDGIIDVSLASGFTPADGAQYTLLSADGGIATALVDLDFGAGLPGGFTASFNDAMTALILTFSLGLDGDFNGDGVVNAADYTVWRDNLGAPDESSLMNNGDGLNGVDAGDYALWRDNYGATAGAAVNSLGSSQSTVPEPGAALLFTLVSGANLLGRRRRAY